VSSVLLFLAAALVMVTCLTHSILGERRLIGPLMQLRAGVLQNDLARQVLRFAWHFTSALGLVVVWLLIGYALYPSTIDPAMIVLIGLILAGSGLIDAIYTRGKHVGWSLLFAAGATTLASLF
jgi:hypothetical protein